MYCMLVYMYLNWYRYQVPVPSTRYFVLILW